MKLEMTIHIHRRVQTECGENEISARASMKRAQITSPDNKEQGLPFHLSCFPSYTVSTHWLTGWGSKHGGPSFCKISSDIALVPWRMGKTEDGGGGSNSPHCSMRPPSLPNEAPAALKESRFHIAKPHGSQPLYHQSGKEFHDFDSFFFLSDGDFACNCYGRAWIFIWKADYDTLYSYDLIHVKKQNGEKITPEHSTFSIWIPRVLTLTPSCRVLHDFGTAWLWEIGLHELSVLTKWDFKNAIHVPRSPHLSLRSSLEVRLSSW